MAELPMTDTGECLYRPLSQLAPLQDRLPFECRCGQLYATQRELLFHFTRRLNPTHQAAHAGDADTSDWYDDSGPEDVF
jgi:hypothetical protein